MRRRFSSGLGALVIPTLLSTTGVILTCQQPAAAQLLGPTPYLSSADSPFFGGSFNYFHLEDFQDGVLNTPGLSASAGGPVTGNVDSVEAVPAAWSYYSFSATSITFTFNAAALGGILPTHAGVVWTDVGFSSPTNAFGSVFFEAFDATNTSLGIIGPFVLGDGTTDPAKPEDRFFGVINNGGISAIRIAMPDSGDWEVDHVQYGATAISSAAAPEPATLALLATGLLPVAGAAIGRRRKA